MAKEAVLKILLQGEDKASGVLGKVSQSLGGLKKAGMAMTAGGAAITGALGMAVKSAVDFESGMREVNTMMGLGQKEFQALSDDVLDMSKSIGVNAVDSTKALYQAISAGVPKENAIDFLAIASKAAIGGVTDTETAVDGLTTVMNAFKLPLSDAQKVADLMFTTVKGGKTTFEELSASMFNVAPMAATAGVKFEEVSAAIATLTKQGVPTAQATTQLRAAIQALLKPTAEMTDAILGVVPGLQSQGKLSGELVDRYKHELEALSKLGLKYQEIDQSTKEGAAAAKEIEAAIADQQKVVEQAAAGLGQAIIESEGLVGAFELLGGTAQGNTQVLGKMFGSVEGLSAVLGTTGENAKMFAGDLEAMGKAAEGAGASTEAFNEMNQSAARQMALMKEKLQGVMISIGQQLIPVLTPLVQKIAAVIQKVIEWMQKNPALTSTIIKIAAVLGGLMVVLGPLLMMLPGIIAGVGALGGVFAALMGPVGIAIAAIAALIAIGVLVYKNWDTIKAKAEAIWNGIKEFFKTVLGAIVGFFRENWDKILAILFPAVGIPILIARNWDKVKSYFRGFWENLKSMFKGAINWLIGLVEGWANSFVNALNGMIGALNAFKVKAPDWVPFIGGKEFGFNVPKIPTVSLPRLAEGAIIKRPTVALLGEKGPEAVTPLGMARNLQPIITYVTVYIGNEKVADFVDKALDRRKRIQQVV